MTPDEDGADRFGPERAMPHHRLGRGGPMVSALGLGCLGLSELYGSTEEGESVSTIHAALDAGITLLDTGDFYGSGHNELLIAAALRNRRRDDVVLSVKFGALRDPAGGFGGYDGRPVAVRNFLAATLRRLGTDHVDIYRIARTDPDVPIEETVGAMAEMVGAGFVRFIGLSEAAAGDVKRAAATHPICDLQIEYSLFARDIERGLLPLCREHGISITAYGVLSLGLLSEAWSEGHVPVDDHDIRAISPRFQGSNLERNRALLRSLRTVADARGATLAQLAIAWVMAQGDDIVPLVGARTRSRLQEALGALDHPLTAADLAQIAQAVPDGTCAGSLYPTGG
jgi:aryl-alcohol dehydrogenase-like predicted oxidoreductase